MRAHRIGCRALILMCLLWLLAGCAGSLSDPAEGPPSAAEPPPIVEPNEPPAAAAPPPTAAPSEPTAVPGPLPTPTGAPDVATLVQAAFERMGKGRILYNPPEQMRMGQSERVEVRISQEGGGERLAEGLEGKGTPRVEAIPVATFMKVRLVGTAFVVTPLSSEEQVVTGEGYTQWAWDITPQESGDQSLDLIVTARVKLPGYSDEQKDLQIIRRQIRVQVDPGYAILSFIRSKDWLFTAVLIPLVAAASARIWHRFRQRKGRSSAREG